MNDVPSFQIRRTSLEFLDSEPGSLSACPTCRKRISGPPLISDVTDEDDQQVSFLLTFTKPSADTNLFHRVKIPKMTPDDTITL